MPSYPTSVYVRPDPIPTLMSTTPTHSTILGQYGDEIEALESTIGVSPQGSAASVAARLTAIEARRGCSISRAALQSAAGTGGLTTISFDAETQDTNGFFAPTSTTVTIPTGYAGVYVISATVNGATLSWGAGSAIRITTSVRSYDFGPTATARMTATLVEPLAVANTIQVAVINGGTTQDVTAVLNVYRMAL